MSYAFELDQIDYSMRNKGSNKAMNSRQLFNQKKFGIIFVYNGCAN